MEKRTRRPSRSLVVLLLVLAGFMAMLSGALGDIEPLTELDLKEAGLICSGPKSRAARLSLEENLYGEVAREGYELPASCPLAKSNDMLLPLEAHKHSRASDRWKCKLCKRSFSGEEYLDLHLKKKHPEVWSETGSVCLGDYCDILRCHEYQEKAPIGAASTGCTPATLEKRKFECKSVMHKCFPPEAGEAAHRLNAQFTRSFCDELSCTPTESKRSKWTKVGNVLWWILAASVGVGLIIFYGVVWFYRRNQRLSSDLRRLSSKRQVSRLRAWGKAKGY
jgi:hypothetical protein